MHGGGGCSIHTSSGSNDANSEDTEWVNLHKDPPPPPPLSQYWYTPSPSSLFLCRASNLEIPVFCSLVTYIRQCKSYHRSCYQYAVSVKVYCFCWRKNKMAKPVFNSRQWKRWNNVIPSDGDFHTLGIKPLSQRISRANYCFHNQEHISTFIGIHRLMGKQCFI